MTDFISVLAKERMALLDAAELEIDRQIAALSKMVGDAPLAGYVPFGLPGSWYCETCERLWAERDLAVLQPPCPGCGESRHCKPTRGLQYAAHCSNSVEVLCTGGNRSGKSLWMVVNRIFHITGDYPWWWPPELRLLPGEMRSRPLRFRLNAPTYEKGINDVIWPIFMQYLPRDFRIEPKKNSQGGYTQVTFPNGAEMSFLTYGQSPTVATGWHGDGADFDEPPENEVFYTETLRGLLDNNGRSFLAMTPLQTVPWVDKQFARVARSAEEWPVAGPYTTKPAWFQFSLDDNPTILEARKEHWSRRLDAGVRRARVNGELVAHEFKVLRQWDDQMNRVPACEIIRDKGSVLIKDPAWRTNAGKGIPPVLDGYAPVTVLMGLDPHDARAQYAVWMAVWPPDRAGVSKKRIIRELADQERTTIGETAALIRDIETASFGPASTRIIDPNFGAKKYGNTGRTTVQEWNRAGQEVGWPLYFAMGNDDVALGHNAIRKALLGVCADGTAELAVWENCGEILDACRYARYTGKYEIDKHSVFLHWIDPMRYLMLQRPRYDAYRVGAETKKDDEPYIPDPETGY